MKASLLLALPFLGLSVLADEFLQFGSGELPACASSCVNLQNAQQVCQPPAQQPKSCFCQSAYLTALKTTPTGTCDTECPSASDRQQVMSWYNSYCNNAQEQPSVSATSAIATQNTATASLAGATSTADAGAGASTDGGATSSSGTYVVGSNGSWWSSHKGWIAMVIVLIVAFSLIIAGGIWWRKRSIAKRDRTSVPLPIGWGPNANPHDYAGPTGVDAEKSATAAATVSEPPVGARGHKKLGSKKVKKALGRA